MKRFLIGLLAVGLIAAFSMPVLAVDVKISGQYWVAGYMESNRAMRSSDERSEKYYGSFFRIEPVFNVAEGLKLVTRFEGLKRVAGLNAVGSETANGVRDVANEQSIAMKRAYISAKIPTGQLDVGYMAGGRWGLEAFDYEQDVFRIKYTGFFGPVIILALTEKGTETSLNAGTTNVVAYSDGTDYDKYALAGIYKWSGGEAGYLQYYLVNNGGEGLAVNPYKRKFYLGVPYFKATIGAFYMEGEADYYWGKFYDYLNAATQGVDFSSLSWWLKAKYTMGPAYVGLMAATYAGDDPSTKDKYEGNPTNLAGAGQGYSYDTPVLVLWNDWTSIWSGQSYGTYGTQGTGGMPTNVKMYQVFAGFKPMTKLAFDAAFTLMSADQKPTGYVDDKIGNEFDIKATYKLYDNLEYMIAFGYLWAGDYFKGTSADNLIGNDWLLMHKLTLTF